MTTQEKIIGSEKSIACIIGLLLIGSLAYAENTFRFEASIGSVWIHPQIIANSERLNDNKGNRKAICCELQLRKHTYAAIEIGHSVYPFVKKHFGALPAVWPPAGRPGENGERSYMYDLNLMLKYDLRNVEKSGILTGGHAGLCLGIARYYEGERRWDGYFWDINLLEYIWDDDYYKFPGGWRPVVLTAGIRLGVEILRLGNMDISCYNVIRFRLTNIMIKDYHQSLFESSFALALGYAFK